MWILLTVGFLSIVGQVVLLRELSVASFGIELIYLLAIGGWLLAGAAGAVAGKWPRHVSRPAVRAVVVLFAIALLASVVFVRAARLVFAAVPGAYLPFAQQLLLIVLAVVPASALLGLLFQWAARSYIAAGRSLATAYGVESIGAVVGGMSATLFLAWGVQNFAIAIACAFVAVAAALGPPARRGNTMARLLFIAVTVAMAAVLWESRGLDRRMTAWNHPGLVETGDSPYGRLAIAEAEGQLSVFDNDALWFDTEGSAAETFTHMVLLQHPNPKRVLLLGGGVEGVAEYTLQHAPQVVDYVELNEQMYRTLAAYVPETTRRALAAPNLHVVFTDPRRFLQQRGGYDVILVRMSEPTSGAANRFYTREFFRACARALTDEGVVGFKLQSSENFWTPLLTRRMTSVYRALQSAFPHVVVLPGATNVFVASASPLPAEAMLEARLSARNIHAALVSGPYVRYVYTNDRRGEIARTLQTSDTPANSDVQPICYEYATAMWLSKFFPRLGAVDLPTRKATSRPPREWIVWVAVAALFGLGRIRTRWRDTLLVGVAGFIGMVLEGILILHFQTKTGVIFQDIGLLLTAFMAGLSAGALGFGRLKAVPRWAGPALVGCLMLLGLAIGGVANGDHWGGLLPTTVLLGATGVLVAAVFAYVSLRRAADQSSLVSPLYAADLGGGCAGSLVASLVLIPMLGLALSAQRMALLALLSLALL